MWITIFNIISIIIIGLCIAVLLLATSCYRGGYGCQGNSRCQTRVVRNEGHKCKWELCPYKNVLPENYKKAVVNYTHSDYGSDAVKVDMLHLKFPTLEYDQLDSLLTKN